MSRTSALALVAAALVLGTATIVTLNDYARAASSETPAAAAKSAAAPAPETAAATPPAAVPADAATPDLGAVQPAKDTPELTDEEFNKAFALRKMGKADAPLKLTEFASLSCPHCAKFYAETFPQIKKDYIDTGKIEYTFVDFPLNQPALTAATAALCVPEENYFRYIDYLFKTQNDWAYSDKTNTMLIQDGKLLGADGDKLQKCINSKRLKAAIVDRFQKESKAFEIDATPGFVFNGDKASKFTGEMSYPDFKKVIEIELAKKAKAAK